MAIELAQVARSGDIQSIHQLTQKGANINAIGKDGYRPILWAVFGKSLPALETMLKLGADPNFRFLPDSNQKVDSLITILAAYPDARFLKTALRFNGNPNTLLNPYFKGDTVLFWAVSHGTPDNVSVLAEFGADLDYQSSKGMTAALDAALRSNWRDLLVLYKAGARMDIPNALNQTPISIIETYGDRALPEEESTAFVQLIKELNNSHLLDINKVPIHDSNIHKALMNNEKN